MKKQFYLHLKITCRFFFALNINIFFYINYLKNDFNSFYQKLSNENTDLSTYKCIGTCIINWRKKRRVVKNIQKKKAISQSEILKIYKCAESFLSVNETLALYARFGGLHYSVSTHIRRFPQKLGTDSVRVWLHYTRNTR